MSLSIAMSWLDEATSAPDRAVAIAVVAELVDGPEWRRFVSQRSHLLIRGGAHALLREALGEPAGSLPRARAEAHVAAHGSPLFMIRIATTRAPSVDDARIRTIEAGVDVGRAVFTPDGERIMAFVWGDSPWPSGGPPGKSSKLLQWRRVTGEYVGGTNVGQFREGEGTCALSPDGRRVAVRAHRGTHVHMIDPLTHVVSPRALAELAGTEGANHLDFLADGRIVGDDGYELLVHTIDPASTIRASSIGNGGRVISYRTAQVLIGGGNRGPTPRIAVHDMDTFELRGVAITTGGEPARVTRRRWRDVVGTRNGAIVQALALSPSGTRVATGDWLGDVRVWDVDRVAACGGALDGMQMRAPRVTAHEGWVSALAFVDDARLLSAGWDGALHDVDLGGEGRVRRTLHGHHGFLKSLDVSQDGTEALSADGSGDVVLWDLTRGTSRRPPFVLDYGGHPAPIVLRVTPDQVRIAVGWTEAVFDHHGRLLDTEECEPPAAAVKSSSAYVEVHGFTSDAIDVSVAESRRGDEPAAPSLTFTRDGTQLDAIALEARALAFTWVNAHTLVVLDSGGHVSFWSTRPR